MRRIIGCLVLSALLSLSFAAEARAKKAAKPKAESTTTTTTTTTTSKKYEEPVATTESARRGRLSARAAVYYGLYQIRGYNDASFFGYKDNGKTEGLGVGTTYGLGRAFIDLGVDYFQVNDGIQGFDFQRTDVSLSGGAKFNWIGAFLGVRRAWQSPSNNSFVDTPFRSHGGWNEIGVFAGPSVGPFSMGPMRLSGSVAYNLNWVSGPSNNPGDRPGGKSRASYDGVGAKLRLGFAGSPHAVEVRYQRFANDKPAELDYNEQYLYLGYIFNWNLSH